jgi:putative membrane protein
MPGGGHGRGMWSWWMGGWGWGWFWIGLVLVLTVLLIMWLTRRSGPSGTHTGGDEALRILEERFARGEIDREEFEERRQILRGRSP